MWACGVWRLSEMTPALGYQLHQSTERQVRILYDTFMYMIPPRAYHATQFHPASPGGRCRGERTGTARSAVPGSRLCCSGRRAPGARAPVARPAAEA